MSLDASLIIRYLPLFWIGTKLTIVLAVSNLLLGTVIGLLAALARLSPQRIISLPAAFYSWLFRSTPPLVVLFFVYFGLSQFGIEFSPTQGAIIGLGITNGAYIMEIVRAGIIAIDPGQWEAARSLGLSYAHTMRRIVFPQAMRIIAPPYISNATAFVKYTSLAMAIAAEELMGMANRIMSATLHPFEPLLMAAVIYLVLNALLMALQSYAEARWALR